MAEINTVLSGIVQIQNRVILNLTYTNSAFLKMQSDVNSFFERLDQFENNVDLSNYITTSTLNSSLQSTLENYYKKSDIDGTFYTKNQVNELLANSFSCNFTDVLHTKLNGIEPFAQENVIERIKFNDIVIPTKNKTIELSSYFQMYTTFDDISTVGKTGNYADLLNAPTKLSDFYNDISLNGTGNQSIDFSIFALKSEIPDKVSKLSDANNYVLKTDLKPVAQTGLYSDLINKPLIPSVVTDLSDADNYVLKTDLNNFITSEDDINGNAATATKLETERTISLSGSVTGSANFDGSNDITIITELDNINTIESLLFKIPEISETQTLNFKIEFSNYENFESIARTINTLNVENLNVENNIISGLNVFTGTGLTGFPVSGVNYLFSGENISLNLKSFFDNNTYLNYPHFRFQWIITDVDEVPVYGKFGYGNIHGVQQIFDDYDSVYLADKPEIVFKSSLSEVAKSGSYEDLSGKPLIPSSVTDLSDANNYVLTSDLSLVAKSGSYIDLTDKPSIPSSVAELSDVNDYALTSDLSNLNELLIKLYERINYLEETVVFLNFNNSSPLTFIIKEDDSSIVLNKNGSPVVSGLQYRLNKDSDWIDYECGTIISGLNKNEYVQFQNTENTLSLNTNNYVKFAMSGQIAALGNIQSMLNYSNSCSAYCYYSMFSDCSSLLSPPKLLASDIAASCYQLMFKGCTSLTSAPKLSASILFDNCYNSMFMGCSALLTAPKLLAETLVNGCYLKMFNGCSSLNSINVGFTDWMNGLNATMDWLEGTSSNGTFIKPESLEIINDFTHIPENWTIKTF